MQTAIARRRAASVIDYSVRLESLAPSHTQDVQGSFHTIGRTTGGAGSAFGNNRADEKPRSLSVDTARAANELPHTPTLTSDALRSMISGHSEASNTSSTGRRESGARSDSQGSGDVDGDLPVQSGAQASGGASGRVAGTDDASPMEELTKPYDVHALYKTVQGFFDSASLWRRDDQSLVDAALKAAAVGAESPRAKDGGGNKNGQHRPILRTRSYLGERFDDGVLDLDDWDDEKPNTIPPILTPAARRKLQTFNIHRSKTWARIINLAILLNCCVAFIEAPYVCTGALVRGGSSTSKCQRCC